MLQRSEVAAGDADRARRRLALLDQQAHDRRLAGSGRADDEEKLAAADVERGAVEADVAGRVVHADVAKLDHVARVRRRRRSAAGGPSGCSFARCRAAGRWRARMCRSEADIAKNLAVRSRGRAARTRSCKPSLQRTTSVSRHDFSVQSAAGTTWSRVPRARYGSPAPATAARTSARARRRRARGRRARCAARARA